MTRPREVTPVLDVVRDDVDVNTEKRGRGISLRSGCSAGRGC